MNTTTRATESVNKCRRLEGKVAVVTASTAGIGLAIAERLGQEGARVVISSRKQEHVDSAVERLKGQGISAFGQVCHVGKIEDRQRLLQKTDELFGGVDILVSNAAVNPAFGPLFEITEETWDKIFEINVKSSFFLCKEALPYMKKKGGGSIILVSSIVGYAPHQLPKELIGSYSVSKTALLGLVKAMSIACADRNIRVNAIAPGLIRTNFSKVVAVNVDWIDMAAIIPMGRSGEPEECAGAVAFLASSDASYITGETIVMAGGMSSRL